MKKKITIAIPVFNGEKYITEALGSIVNQTVKVDKILVCDNQSTDNTRNIVEEFFSEHKGYESRLHINESNIGYQRNFNKCMELCDTEYLLLLSSDDCLKPYAIEKQIAFYESHPDFALVGGNADSIDENGKLIHQPLPIETQIYKKGKILEFVKNNRLFMFVSSILLNMEFINQIGYWDDYAGPDERYWPKVLQSFAIAVLGESLMDRRIHTGQTAKLDYASKFSELIVSLKANETVANYESTPERIDELKSILKKQNSESSIMMGSSVLRDYGKLWVALKYWSFGIKKHPAVLYETGFLTNAAKMIFYQLFRAGRKDI
jgi:glycosyltransferase involved in cell wall biosynthesis